MNTLTISNAAKMAMLITVIAAARSSNQIVGITFIKKDGSKRTMAFRTGLSTGVKGTGGESSEKAGQTLIANNMMRVYDLKRGWRVINLATTTRVRYNGDTYNFAN